MKIIGSFVSPYVRKVLVALEMKGLTYEIDPITPFFGNDHFERLSPLRRIPVLVDGDTVLCDSSVIAAYLDDAYPQVPLVRGTPVERARIRWFEEYADTRLGDLFIWGLFYPKVVHPLVWGEPGDQARIDKGLSTGIPRAMDYLEEKLPADGFLVDDRLSLGDITVAAMFRNAALAGFVPEAWPTVTAYLARAFAEAPFVTLKAYEDIQLSASIQGRRQALHDAGVRLAQDTVGQREPRKGVMRL